MKRLLLILPILIIALSVYGQAEVEYSYDSAGNRITREIVLSQSSSRRENSDKEFYSDKLLEYTIRIYPNPTKGNLQVDILGVNNETIVNISMYDLNGRLIDKASINSGRAQFDLITQPTGVYIMKIKIEDKTTSWKIIKE